MSSTHFQIVLWFYSWILRVLYILDAGPLLYVWLPNIFSQPIILPFHPLNSVCCRVKVFNFDVIKCFFLWLPLLLVLYLTNHCLVKGHEELCLFSCKIFIVLVFPFKSLIHSGLIFVCGMRYRSRFILLHVNIQFSLHCLLKSLFFWPLNGLETFVGSQLVMDVYFWILSFISWVSMSFC